MEGLRIVLVGKQGAGKSSAGNTLLRQPLFKTAACTKRVTQTCSMHTTTIEDQTILVVDTPGWPVSLSEAEIKQEIMKCIDMCSPGPHVFLLVLPIGRFTNEEINTAWDILKEFGKDVYRHTLLLFTKGDDLEDKSIEEYLEDVHKELKTIQKHCGGYHVFNNRDKNNHCQVSSLLQKIRSMVENNDKKCYTKTIYHICSAQLENLSPKQSNTVFKKTETNEDINSEMSETESDKLAVSTPRCDEKKNEEMMIPSYESIDNELKRAPKKDDEKTTIGKLEQMITIQKQLLLEINDMTKRFDHLEEVHKQGIIDMTKQFDHLEERIKEIKDSLSKILNKEDENVTAKGSC